MHHEQASFELTRESGLSLAAVGRTIVHRPRREHFPLVMSVLFGMLSLAMLAGAALSGSYVRDAWPLIALESVIGLVFGVLTVKLVPAALAGLRFNRLAYVVCFATDRVVIANATGEEVVTLADAADHPFLRGLAVDWRIHLLTQVRAACEPLDPLDERRLILESLALHHLDPDPEGFDEDSPVEPILAVVIGPGDVQFFRNAEEFADAGRQDWPLHSIRCEWDPEQRTRVPVFMPSAVTRLSSNDDPPK